MVSTAFDGFYNWELLNGFASQISRDDLNGHNECQHRKHVHSSSHLTTTPTMSSNGLDRYEVWMQESDTSSGDESEVPTTPRTSRGMSTSTMPRPTPLPRSSSAQGATLRDAMAPMIRREPTALRMATGRRTVSPPRRELDRMSIPSLRLSEEEQERLTSRNNILWNLLDIIEPPRYFGERWEPLEEARLLSIGITDPLVLAKAAQLSRRMKERIGRI